MKGELEKSVMFEKYNAKMQERREKGNTWEVCNPLRGSKTANRWGWDAGSRIGGVSGE